MGCSDKGETPPPLPVKGSNADYGNLVDNQDLTSPSTPPPPPPHQRVGVLIRAERSSLMMHGTYNETRGRYTHLTFRSTSSTIPYPCMSCANVHASVSVCVHACFTLTFVLYFCNVCHRRVQASVSQQRGPTPACPPRCYLYLFPPASPVLRRD